jgi:hypothetical protein
MSSAGFPPSPPRPRALRFSQSHPPLNTPGQGQGGEAKPLWHLRQLLLGRPLLRCLWAEAKHEGRDGLHPKQGLGRGRWTAAAVDSCVERAPRWHPVPHQAPNTIPHPSTIRRDLDHHMPRKAPGGHCMEAQRGRHVSPACAAASSSSYFHVQFGQPGPGPSPAPGSSCLMCGIDELVDLFIHPSIDPSHSSHPSIHPIHPSNPSIHPIHPSIHPSIQSIHPSIDQ